MKVLNLQCDNGHPFEGWFASEDDFQSQNARALLACPMCGSAHVVKKPSAPRLNLAAGRSPDRPLQTPQAAGASAAGHNAAPAGGPDPAALWAALSRHILATTQDVGERFAEEARKMHYGEAEERAIRGRTSLEEARALQEEGISVLPLALPAHLRNPLH